MMKKNSFLLLLVFPFFLYAQEKEKGWRSIPSAGIAIGEQTASPAFQVSTGRYWGRTFTGLGVGYDRYRFHSFPLFVDGRRSFGKRQSLFVYGMTGYNFPANRQPGENEGWRTVELAGGFFFDAGLGFRLPVGNSNRFLFSAGYSQKQMKQITTESTFCIFGPCPVYVTSDQYNFGRILAKLSWEFSY